MSVAQVRRFGVGLLILLAALTNACSTQARRVDCDGRLEPVNQPAPKVKGALPHEPAAPVEKPER